MINIRSLSFSYPGQPVPALNDVTMSFGTNELVLVTGKLGSGCSTLLMVLAGVAPRLTGGELSGEVSVLGRQPECTEFRELLGAQLGVLLSNPRTQLSGLADTVWQEVAFGPANLGRQRDQIGEAVDRALEASGIAHLGDRDPRTLSGGELQLVLLAAISAPDPKIYLLDEPTAELDGAAKLRFCERLPQLKQNGLLIIASKDLDRLAPMADRVVLMDGGHLVSQGSPGEVLGEGAGVEAGCLTTAGELAQAAGWNRPFPVDVEGLVARVRS